jgi:hypothetical protein
VSSIRFLATRIHRTVQDFDSNEKDCYDLNVHVNEVVGYLEYFESDSQFNQQFKQPLMDLEACLIECLEFVQKFDNTSLFGQILRSHHYKRKFEDLNNQLDQCKGRLFYLL